MRKLPFIIGNLPSAFTRVRRCIPCHRPRWCTSYLRMHARPQPTPRPIVPRHMIRRSRARRVSHPGARHAPAPVPVPIPVPISPAQRPANLNPPNDSLTAPRPRRPVAPPAPHPHPLPGRWSPPQMPSAAPPHAGPARTGAPSRVNPASRSAPASPPPPPFRAAAHAR